MKKYLLLYTFAYFTHAHSIELLIASQELNFNKVAQIIEQKKYSAQELIQASEYIKKIVLENKQVTPWHKKYWALSKTAIGIVMASGAAVLMYEIQKQLNADNNESYFIISDNHRTSLILNSIWALEWLIVGPYLTYSGVKELRSSYGKNYKKALAIQSLLKTK